VRKNDRPQRPPEEVTRRPRERIRLSASIAEVMTRDPITVREDARLSEAHVSMRRHGIRHLPVVNARDAVVGLLSHRDLYLFEAVVDGRRPDAVAQAMTANPYCVPPTEPVSIVARTMAERRLGSAIVANEGRVLGIFTSSDALLFLARILDAPAS